MQKMKDKLEKCIEEKKFLDDVSFFFFFFLAFLLLKNLVDSFLVSLNASGMHFLKYLDRLLSEQKF